MTSAGSIGDWGEQVAVEHLQAAGYGILVRNWHGPRGEIDIVAEQEGVLVFVEVKARRGRRYGTPEAAVTGSKQRSLQRTAWGYLEANQADDRRWRIDVIAIEGDPASGVQRLDHYVNAVEEAPDLDGSG
ncbi:MAG TPA: YraN family protein [Anaerolineales bacterium]